MKSKQTAVQARLDTHHYTLLKHLAAHLDLSLSQVIRRAIRELAKREKVE